MNRRRGNGSSILTKTCDWVRNNDRFEGGPLTDRAIYQLAYKDTGRAWRRKSRKFYLQIRLIIFGVILNRIIYYQEEEQVRWLAGSCYLNFSGNPLSLSDIFCGITYVYVGSGVGVWIWREFPIIMIIISGMLLFVD